VRDLFVRTSDLWACNLLLLDTNTFSLAQDPAMEPTRVTEGIFPVRMNRVISLFPVIHGQSSIPPIPRSLLMSFGL
jgi:hypothetical protein